MAFGTGAVGYYASAQPSIDWDIAERHELSTTK